MLTKKIALRSGLQMPVIGLGTWKMSEEEAEESVCFALQNGYRHIDTAMIYKNETGVGKGIKKSGIPREEIFVVTKVWNEDHHDVRSALLASLQRLGLEYVDLYLMHWPLPTRNDAWKQLEALKQEGLCRGIGVCNFKIAFLQELLANCTIKPDVNQVEFHPFLYQKELMEFCVKQGIQLECYSPLARGTRFSNENIQFIAEKHKKTPAQVMLKWAVQHGLVVIPKSVSFQRIVENLDLDFTLTLAEMAVLDGLNENDRLVGKSLSGDIPGLWD